MAYYLIIHFHVWPISISNPCSKIKATSWLNISLIHFLCSNPLVPCDAITIPLIDLLPWQEGHTSPIPFQESINTGFRKPSQSLQLRKPSPPLQRHFNRLPRQHSSFPPDFASPSMKIKPFVHPGVHTPLHRFRLSQANFGRWVRSPMLSLSLLSSDVKWSPSRCSNVAPHTPSLPYLPHPWLLVF